MADSAIFDITQTKLADAALQAQLSLLGEVTSAAPGMLFQFAVQPDGTRSFPFVSANAADLFEVPLETIRAAPLSMFSHVLPEDRAGLDAAIEVSRKKLSDFFHDFRIRTGTGRVRWLSTRSHPRLMPDGTVLWNGTAIDSTELREGQNALAENDRRYRDVFFAVTDAVLVHTFDLGSNPKAFIEANEPACRMLGYSRAKLLQLNPENIVDPAHRERIPALLDAIVRQGSLLFEINMVAADGRTFPAEVHARIYQQDDHYVAYSIIRDVSHRHTQHDALRRSEELHRLLFENAHDIIAKLKPEGVFLYVSPACRTLLGYEPEEMEGRSLHDFIHPEDTATVTQFLALVRDDPVVSAIAYRMRRKDKTYLWAEATARATGDGPNNSRAIISVFRDVTERRMAEAARAATVRKFESLVSALGEVVYERLLPEDLIVWSDNVKAVFDYSRQQMGNDSASWTKRVHPDDLPSVLAEFQNAVKEGRAYDMQYRFLNKRGDYLWVHDRGVQQKGPDRKPRATIGIMRDITESLWMEEELKESEERFRSTFVDAPIGMVVASREGSFIDVNPRLCAMLGYTQPDLLELGFEDIICEQDLRRAKEHIRKLVDDETKVLELEIQCTRRTGDRIWVQFNASVVGRDRDLPLCLIGQLQDITQRKNSERLLRENEDRMRLVLDVTSEGVWDVNLATGETYYSPNLATLLGFNTEELVPHISSWKQLLHPDEAEDVLRRLREHIDGEAPFFQAEFRMRTKHGDWKRVYSRGKIIAWDAKGRPTRLVGAHFCRSDTPSDPAIPPYTV